jgi:phosphate transport system substrate-binding protein
MRSVWSPARPARRRLAHVLAVMALAACAAPTPEPTPVTFTIAATELAAPLAQDLADAYRAAAPGSLPIVTITPQTALAAELAAGRADLAFTAQPLGAEAGQFATPLGYAPLAVIIHRDNPLAVLSLAQVRALFAGQIADWAQVGGAAGPVQAVTREAGSDGAQAFQAAALGEAEVTLNALVAPTWAAMRTLVGESAGALGYLPRSELDNSVKALSLEAELWALIAATAPAEPAGAARAFLAWAQSEAGQAVVARRHQPAR